MGFYKRPNPHIHVNLHPSLHPNPFVSCPTEIGIFPGRSPLPTNTKSKQKSQRPPNTSNASIALRLSNPITSLAEIQFRRPRLHLCPPTRTTSITPSLPSSRKKRRLLLAASPSRATRIPTSHGEGEDCWVERRLRCRVLRQ